MNWLDVIVMPSTVTHSIFETVVVDPLTLSEIIKLVDEPVTA
jgi:hypothetical protein